MTGFVVGSEPGDGEGMEQLLEFLADLDGFMEYEALDTWEGIAWFRDEETAQTAQWMMDMAGMEKIDDDGGAECPDGRKTD